MKIAYNLNNISKNNITGNSAYWEYRLARMKILLSNDPAVIRKFYQQQSQNYSNDSYTKIDDCNSFFAGAKFNNAFVYLGLIPMLMEIVAKNVNRARFEFLRHGDELAVLPWERVIQKLTTNVFGLGDCLVKVVNKADRPYLSVVAPEYFELEWEHEEIKKYIVKDIVEHRGNEYVLKEIYYTDGDGNNILEYDVVRLDGKIAQEQTKNNILADKGITERVQVLETKLLPVVYLGNINGVDFATNNERGQSEFFGLETFESAITEILSNMIDEIRKAGLKIIMSESVCKFDAKNRSYVDDFEKSIIITADDNTAGRSNLIQTVQGIINADKYVLEIQTLVDYALAKVGFPQYCLGIITGDPSGVSLEERQKQIDDYMSEKITAVFDTVEKIANIVCECYGFTDGTEIRHTNASDFVTVSLLEKIRIKLELGLESVVDAIMETSNLTREEATAKYAENILQQKALAPYSEKEPIINHIVI